MRHVQVDWWMVPRSGVGVGRSRNRDGAKYGSHNNRRRASCGSSKPGAAPTPNTGATAVRLRPIELADYLRTRALIVRHGDNELDFRDFARWGEALGTGITRVLREEFAARAAPVATGGMNAGPAEQKIELRIRVLACEGAADGGVRFHATWELLAIGGVAARRGDYHPATLRWDGENETTLAAALSEAIAGLAAEIAPSIAKK